MIGDSITDAGRAQPYGEGLVEPYVRGYVNLVNTLASFGEPGYVEDRPVQQWVEQFSSAFDEWVKEMDAGFTGFGPSSDEDFADEEESGSEEEDAEEDGESDEQTGR